MSKEIHIVFPLSGGNAVSIGLCRRCSLDDYEAIKRLVELSKPGLVADEPETTPLDTPPQAQ